MPPTRRLMSAQSNVVVKDGRAHFFQVLSPEQASRDYSFELKFDDGNRLTLHPQTAVLVNLYETDCFEETGRWQGTAGGLRNHEGTFTMHYDSIQTVLRFVED